jgi:hypothetical protein
MEANIPRWWLNSFLNTEAKACQNSETGMYIESPTFYPTITIKYLDSGQACNA